MKLRNALAAAPLSLAAWLVASSALADKPDPDPWFGEDKALHFTACGLISGTAYGVTSLATRSWPARIGIGAGAGIAAGAGKELLDLAGLGDPSWKDFAWDVFGTAVGVGIAITIDYATRGPDPKPVHAVTALRW
jgi:putative lipoprotein